jgi:UrcA family protein
MRGTTGWMACAVTMAMLATPGRAICAAYDEPPRSVRIETRDLDLAKTGDVERLYARIRRASRQVCDWQVSVLYLQMARTSIESCYAATVSQIVARLDLPALSGIHRNAGTR